MIIGTAIKIGDLTITAFEAPHDTCIFSAHQLCVKDIDEKLSLYENYGFYDENGKYYNRADAAIHAFECGQINEKVPNLISEHLGW